MILIDNEWHGREISRLVANCTPYINRVDHCVSNARNGRLLGGVIFQNFMGDAVNIHVAGISRGWLTRELLATIFDVAFNRLKVKQVLGFVPETNARALAFDQKIGFVPIFTIPDVVPGGGLVILSMYRNQCRWLKEDHGQHNRIRRHHAVRGVSAVVA